MKSLKILILGANGFIGSNLSKHLLQNRENYYIHAMDLADNKLDKICHRHSNFAFFKGDITKDKQWVEDRIKECDVILPLVAIANPSIYVTNPLAVFHLDFEANLEIVKLCSKYGKRVIFPSTSEVYGMSADIPYNEETSNFTVGPIQKERWIYSSCKQLLDRVIYAYGHQHNLPFTLFRPFNWYGPNLDNPWNPESGSNRVASQFLSALFNGKNLSLVNGGAQRRCFIYIDDAIEALTKIIDNKEEVANGQIFNIGNPNCNLSIKELANLMLACASKFEELKPVVAQTKVLDISGDAYYGKGYQDLNDRVPCIDNASNLLHWLPSTNMETGLAKTIAFYLKQKA